MPNPFTELLAAGDADARKMLGVPAEFARRGVKYATAMVIFAPAESELVYAAGGAELRVEGTATVNKGAMVTPPVVGDSVTCNGRRYYVVHVATSPQDVIYALTLGV